MSDTGVSVGGPFYDDLTVGQVFDTAPAVTLTDGLAAAHHAIVGGRLRLAFDRELATRVTGGSFASPAMVWDFAIGQTTSVTQRAIANLFYRGLRFLHFPTIGDTIGTRTTIVGLRPVSAKPGRPPRGLAVMHMVTTDQAGRTILDFHRCAMLPARTQGDVASGVIDPPEGDLTTSMLTEPVSGWDLVRFRKATPGPHFAGLAAGTRYSLEAGDVVTSAPELARLTFNLAAIHHDASASSDGRRLVYGGHTIGLAAAQITRALPSLVTILAWQSCDHTGPVHERDTLHSSIAVERVAELSDGGGLAYLRVLVRATRADTSAADVLDWRLVGLFA